RDEPVRAAPSPMRDASAQPPGLARRMRPVALVCAGAIAGVLVSLGISAVAQKDSRSPLQALPLEELRQFADVFGAIKGNYVETVEDKKLIKEAISGMLSGLDPHSAFLDAKAYKEMQLNTSGQFGIGAKDGILALGTMVTIVSRRGGVMKTVKADFDEIIDGESVLAVHRHNADRSRFLGGRPLAAV
ncbi:MAG: hypothetical protein EBX62_09360, partial [Betaproteobacteria bacterium]|nr:hypothetical protein [Betaproteobacteria bacterium]